MLLRRWSPRRATGIFGAGFLDAIGIWDDPPWLGGRSCSAAVALALALLLDRSRRRERGTSVLLSVEGVTVALILVVARSCWSGCSPATRPATPTFTLDVFTVAPGTDTSTLFLGIVFGFLSFAGFEAAATLGEEARNPRRDIPRAILGTAIFGGIYFTVVTAIEMMGFGTDEAGVAAFTARRR